MTVPATHKPVKSDVSDTAEVSRESLPQSDTDLPEPERPIRSRPSHLKLSYDIVMVIIISIDLLLISVDGIAMSDFSSNVASWLSLNDALKWYQGTFHQPLRIAGGFFTIFLIIELLVRWAIAIQQKIYYRWFFFPFIHWYEVLGCFPQLRALRLFRVLIIGRRLYQLGYQVLPQPWIRRIKFYIDLVLEELSDRVILTAIDNYRLQLTDPNIQKSLINSIVARNREEIEAVLLNLLRQELVPQLLKLSAHAEGGKLIASEVGNAIQDGLANTPQLRRYLRLIPIAGTLIEAELQHIGHDIGENVAYSLNNRLLDPERLDSMMVAIVQGIINIDASHTDIEGLIASIVADSLSEFEAQIKIQQWKHKDMLSF